MGLYIYQDTYTYFKFLLFIAMSSKRTAKWQLINKRVKKHLAILEIQNNETENSFQGEKEVQTITELQTKLKHSLDSDVSEHSQTFDNSIVENIDNNIFNCASDASDNESCSSIENYVVEDDIIKESNNRNGAEFFSNNNNINTFNDCTNSNLSNDLAQWAVEFNISHTPLNSLLCILKNYNFTLPSDARTLLKTQRKASVFDMYDGKYCYFGIANTLKMIISEVPILQSLQKIDLFVNIDGIPLANSSSVQFWPILCKINQSLYKLEPFIVAVYCGQSKPSNIEEYLKDFINEYKILCNTGIVINMKLYSVSILGFICDAPARAFIKQIKGHTGFYGCERCIQKGTHPFGATIFNKIDSELRTNESFLSQSQFEHHNGVSPLVEINFPMVTGFILDPMHLVYLGIIKRILFLLVQGNNYFCKLDARRINLMSEILQSLRKNIPVDFARKPQSLNKVKN